MGAGSKYVVNLNYEIKRSFGMNWDFRVMSGASLAMTLSIPPMSRGVCYIPSAYVNLLILATKWAIQAVEPGRLI